MLVAFALALVGLSLPSAWAAPAPTVTAFSPACAAAGASVAIGGQHLQGATSVAFSGVNAAFVVSSGNLVTATVPSTGNAVGKITVTTPEGSDGSTDDFTRADDCTPTVTGFSPGSGPVGQAVTIDGTKLVGATLVEFGGVDQSSFTWSPAGTQITTTVPAGAVDGQIRVTTAGGTATSSASFDVTSATTTAPTIASFVPISGPVGTSVVITGTNLTGATAVTFKNTSATTFTVNSATQITAVVPSGAMTGKIGVTTPGGSASSSSNFTVTAAGSPTITSFTPTSGLIGTNVVITGTNFTGSTAVAFNGTSASFTVNNSTQITATVPPSATTGPITVTNPNGTGTSATDFTVTGAPVITSFAPTSGTEGTSVTISGTGFTGATQVKFRNTSATPFTVNQQGTQIVTTVPIGASSGPITVVAPTGTAVSATDFTVLLTRHGREISLDLRRHLVAKGDVTTSDGFSACSSRVPVKIQRRVSGTWRTIDSMRTDGDGFYRVRIADLAGRYRAKAPKVTIGNDVCARAVSSVETN
jgi:hypothetical protein